MAGMRAKYTVTANASRMVVNPSGVTRTYYIQAEAVNWDYAPAGYQK